MNREEITNSQDYKATKIALDWWYSLPEEQRKATDIDAEPDIVDAYSEGVIYGWNNPNWQQVRMQAAIAVLQGITPEWGNNAKQYAEWAVQVADALVAELKKGGQDDG